MGAELDIDVLVARASGDTGLDDLGDIPYREPLEMFVDSLHRDSGLDDQRLAAAGDSITGLLVKRLRLVDDRKTFPAIDSGAAKRGLTTAAV